MVRYVYIIYSCYKNKHKSDLLYNILERFITGTDDKLYILNGVEKLKTDYCIVNDKHLLIKCGDNYEDLCQKTICMTRSVLSLFPDITGLFKIDDDIIPNLMHFINFQSFVEQSKCHYAGRLLNLRESYSTDHYRKCFNKMHEVPRLCHGGKYSAGPMYYLSKKSISILSNVSDSREYFFEDIMVGHLLNKNGVPINNYISYYDTMNYMNTTIQNIRNAKFLFIRLHGGLGNQLFMVASAYKFAREKNMILILVNDAKHMTHNTADEFTGTIFKQFNSIPIEKMNYTNVVLYNEPRCFDYSSSIVTTDSNYFLNGYFQNKAYISANFISFIQNNDLTSNLLSQYPKLENSYFIHIRLGDYVGKSMYNFDRDTYYKNATEYILQRDPDAHFFVVSDDDNFVNQYAVLNTVNNTIIRDMDTLKSFYFMSMCRKGGICANSTFSGWASQIKSNSDKIVIVPKQWININYPYEIPFHYTVSI